MEILKNYSRKNEPKTVKVIVYAVIACSIGAYNLIHLKSSFIIFNVSNEASVYEMSPSFYKIFPVLNVRSNFHRYHVRMFHRK